MKSTEKASELDTMNYNDRLDGYGFGEAESVDDKNDYQNDPHFTRHCVDLGEGYRKHKNEPFSRDELGLRNQYGPVDQYSFRDIYIRFGDKKKWTFFSFMKFERG